jgi:tetraacyldisaccharide 4'-kinase
LAAPDLGRKGLLELLGAPASLAYALAVALRNWAYDRGILPVERMSVPVISVGNMTAGGTGKTPMVELLLRALLPGGKKLAVVSRGYGRTTSGQVVVSDGASVLCTPAEAGDEAFQVARKFRGVVVVVDASKARAARAAVDDFGAEIVLVDDGFQHRGLARDCDIVLVDSNKPLRSMPLLPSGMRRESVRALGRADIVAYTRCGDPAHAHEAFPEAGRAASCCLRSCVLRAVTFHGGEEFPLEKFRGARVVGFCGIGSPESFRATLDALGCSVGEFLVYPDHHPYDTASVGKIARSAGPGALVVTTEKDAMRILGDPALLSLVPAGAVYLEIAHEFVRGGDAALGAVRAAAFGRAA